MNSQEYETSWKIFRQTSALGLSRQSSLTIKICMLNNTSRIRDRIIYFAQMEDGAGLGSVDSMRQKSLLCWRLTFVCVFTFHIAKAFCSSFILKLWYCPSVKKTNVLCLMATHQCHKKEHALMEHTVLKLFWDLDTWLTALAYWMLHYSEGNGDFEFWFTVWPDKIPMLHPPRWMGLLILTDGAIARNSPTSQHNFWYPVGTRC